MPVAHSGVWRGSLSPHCSGAFHTCKKKQWWPKLQWWLLGLSQSTAAKHRPRVKLVTRVESWYVSRSATFRQDYYHQTQTTAPQYWLWQQTSSSGKPPLRVQHPPSLSRRNTFDVLEACPQTCQETDGNKKKALISTELMWPWKRNYCTQDILTKVWRDLVWTSRQSHRKIKERFCFAYNRRKIGA